MASTSSHLSNIPEAVRIAASTSGVDQQLKEQALEYLNKVRELCEETWQVGYQALVFADNQDCLALYLQGAGSAGSGQPGKDGKEKQGTELRLFCEQVFETALIMK